jgi:tetratricopeptide (TPR) repeat protein
MDLAMARGLEALRAGRHADAIEIFAQAMNAHGESSDAHFYIGAAWNALGHPPRALEAMERAFALRRDSAALAFNVAVLRVELGQRVRAREALATARALLTASPQPNEHHLREQVDRLWRAQGFG